LEQDLLQTDGLPLANQQHQNTSKTLTQGQVLPVGIIHTKNTKTHMTLTYDLDIQ